MQNIPKYNFFFLLKTCLCGLFLASRYLLNDNKESLILDRFSLKKKKKGREREKGWSIFWYFSHAVLHNYIYKQLAYLVLQSHIHDHLGTEYIA